MKEPTSPSPFLQGFTSHSLPPKEAFPEPTVIEGISAEHPVADSLHEISDTPLLDITEADSTWAFLTREDSPHQSFSALQDSQEGDEEEEFKYPPGWPPWGPAPPRDWEIRKAIEELDDDDIGTRSDASKRLQKELDKDAKPAEEKAKEIRENWDRYPDWQRKLELDLLQFRLDRLMSRSETHELLENLVNDNSIPKETRIRAEVIMRNTDRAENYVQRR